MSVLDFLFPFLMAADAHAKVKKNKEKEIIAKELRESSEKFIATREYIEKTYSDINAEFDIEPISSKEILSISKRLPSYDPHQKWNVLKDDGYFFFTKKMQKRLALARAGLLRRGDIHVYKGYTIASDSGYFWGRERYDYRGQIFHELMVEWENELKQNGFPYNLYVYNKVDLDRRNAILARDSKYKYGNIYFWSYDE